MIKAGDFMFYFGSSSTTASNVLVVSVDDDIATVLIEDSFKILKVDVSELYEDYCNTRRQEFVRMFNDEYKKTKEKLNILEDAKSIMDFFC